VREWWSKWPEANIGLSLAASGLVALDPDLYKPDCGWHEFITGKDIPDTLVQTSARGGKHYIFTADPTATFPGKLCKDVEIKHNGYIMLEPSVFEGGRYQFETDDDPAPVPDWVQFESATKPPKIETTAPSARKANGTEIASVKAALGREDNTLDREAWVKLCLAVKGACGDAAREAFIDFSNRFEGATPGEAERLWDTARPDGRLTLGTVYHLLGSGESELTEDGVALAFTSRFGTELRYDHDAGRWYAWTGDRWKVDTKQLAFSWCRVTARELSEGLDQKVRNTVRKRAFASGVEAFARADPIHAVNQDCWDTDPFLLGCSGGAVDLRTGAMLDASPEAGITKHAAVAPAASGDCPLWRQFLVEATQGDADMVEFLQRWCGYCLTGDTREHALIFLYGPGGNGKSVFLNTVAGLMGDYATVASMDVFTASRGDKHPTELAMLRGARMVSASETEEGRAWAESRIKAMTGGDPITARFMRQDFFTYQPEFKLTIVGNHAPALVNVDDAARRRFNIVPFTVKPANPDRELEGKLKAEWPGILRWMIEGAVAWRRHGLAQPESVRAATAEYFGEQDFTAQWLEETCTVDAGNTARWEHTADLFASWCAFAKAAGEDAGSQKNIAARLRRNGLRPLSRKIEGKTYRGWSGVTINRRVADFHDD
jgi:putative DNA primase/helicase